MESAMTHEITTNGHHLLLVEVPEGATKPHIYKVGKTYFLVFHIKTGDHKSFWEQINIELPSGQYQILGKSTELSEEQMKEICEKEYFQGYFQGFRNYMSKQVTPLEVYESYLSLLEANGIVDRNPYDKSGLTFADEYQNKWQEAQSKVRTYLILIGNEKRN